MIGVLRSRSLKFWVALGMIIAIGPLFISAVGGFALLNHGVIASFDDVALRQREQSAPLQRLRILVWETLPPVDEFAERQNHVAPPTYRDVREKIEVEFAGLADAFQDEPATQALIESAHADWARADRYATEIISTAAPVNAAETAVALQRFHGEVGATNDKLTAIHQRVSRTIDRDHDTALKTYELSIWVSAFAGCISLLAIGVGVILIGRVLSESVDRLVKGAVRFAQGDRQHRIEIALPPELHQVATEFNYMIGRIHESEKALSMLAHQDTLTGLENRRSFDETFENLRSGREHLGEDIAVLVIDIDHFKSINDRFGHGVGDEVLCLISRIMLRAVRPVDKVYRIGGEEFAVILPGVSIGQAEDIANRLCKAISATPFAVNDTTIDLSVSIGISTTAQTREQDALMELADSALYEAKKTGRNRVVVSG